MACLDAAARFTPTLSLATTLTLAITAVNRESVTTAPTTDVVFTVIDRKAAEVRARSEFNMILDTPVH